LLRSLDLIHFQKAGRYAVIGALARALDLRLEAVRFQRGEPLPARGLSLVDTEVGELGAAIKVAGCNFDLQSPPLVSRSFRTAISINSSPTRRSARILIPVACAISVVSLACFA